jgi:hypothetical protein
MKRSTAAALFGLLLLGLAVISSTRDGRCWLQQMAVAQVDDVLDTVAITGAQRKSLEDAKDSAFAAVNARFELVRNIVRCAFSSGERRAPKYLIEVPRFGPVSEIRWSAPPGSSWAPPAVSRWPRPPPAPNGYLPQRRGTMATEWQSCCSGAWH